MVKISDSFKKIKSHVNEMRRYLDNIEAEYSGKNHVKEMVNETRRYLDNVELHATACKVLVKRLFRDFDLRQMKTPPLRPRSQPASRGRGRALEPSGTSENRCSGKEGKGAADR